MDPQVVRRIRLGSVPLIIVGVVLAIVALTPLLGEGSSPVPTFLSGLFATVLGVITWFLPAEARTMRRTHVLLLPWGVGGAFLAPGLLRVAYLVLALSLAFQLVLMFNFPGDPPPMSAKRARRLQRRNLKLQRNAPE